MAGLISNVSFHDMGNGNIGVAVNGEMVTDPDQVNSIVAILNDPDVLNLVLEKENE